MKSFIIIKILGMFSLLPILSGINEDVVTAIGAGNSTELAKHFGNTVEMTIPGSDDVYSRTQAELILRRFFNENPVKTFSIVHQGTSKLGTYYAIGSLKTSKGGTFRVSYYIKKEQNREYIIQLHIGSQ